MKEVQMNNETRRNQRDESEHDTTDESASEIRQLARDVYLCLILDIWPTNAGMVDFGILSGEHYAAMQEAVRVHGVTEEQLDRAMCKGAELTALIGPENSYHGLVFTTPWDELARWSEDECDDEPTPEGRRNDAKK
jgi:hypothetical protein